MNFYIDMFILLSFFIIYINFIDFNTILNFTDICIKIAFGLDMLFPDFIRNAYACASKLSDSRYALSWHFNLQCVSD